MTNLGLRNVLIAWLLLTGTASAEHLWGLTTNHTLVRFALDAPWTVLASLPITGLPEGERLVAIEVLDLDGTFVGVSTAGRFYALDRLTGAATSLNPDAPAVPLTGTAFGMTTSLNIISIVSNDGSTWRGATNDWILTPRLRLDPPAHVVALSSSSHPSSASVSLDSNTDTLSYYHPVTSKLLTAPLSVDTSDEAGMDAGPRDGKVYGALTVNGSPGLYAIDWTTGTATLIGAIAAAPITSLAFDLQVARGGLGFVDVVEGNTTVTFSVHRVGDIASPGQYLVETLSRPHPPATPGQDFVAKSELLEFAAGEVEKTITVSILDDAERETREHFEVSVRENYRYSRASIGQVTIVDDENQPPVLTVTSPGLRAYTSLETIDLTGTVTDDTGGFEVILWATDPYQEGALQVATGSPWTFNVTLRPGYNLFHVVVRDAQGESTDAHLEIWRPSEETLLFAEGATGSFFDTELAFANPQAIDVPVTIEFLREDGTVVPHSFTLGAERRATLNLESVPGLEGTTAATVVRTAYPIMAERTMRWDATGYGAHSEKASPRPYLHWVFAEGSQGFFFTYVQLLNPHASDNEVTVRFLLEQGPPVTKSFTLAPHARYTVDAGSIPELRDRSFGIQVRFAQPGLAERAMYFGLDPLWKAGHAVAGAFLSHHTWFLAEGATGPFFETFVLVANPSSQAATITMTFLPENGAPVTRTKQVPALGRLTVNIEHEAPSLANAVVATRIYSTESVVVERSQYWPWTPDQWYEAHANVASSTDGMHWGLAEGRVGGPGGYQTYIQLANWRTESAAVTIRFLRESGPPVVRQFTVPSMSRYTVDAGGVLGSEMADGVFAADIRSTVPITVERSTYASGNGQFWSSGTNASATLFPW